MRLIPALTALLLGALLVQGAAADPPRRERESQAIAPGLSPQHNAQRMGPGEAARIAQQRHGGRVLAVDPVENGYRVKLLDAGEVRMVFIARD
ncbi:MAG: hypothetical protein ACLGHI_00355 [Gammaproteobacteria bacterium]